MGLKATQRVVHLLGRVQGGAVLALSEAADLFDVSKMTVRRDIAASNGRLAVLGGHVIAVADAAPPYALDREQDARLVDKIAACEHALSLIEREDTIFIDSGTTTCHIASRLPQDFNLTVVCFAMNVAVILSRMPGIRWLLTGGHYQPATASFLSPHGPEMLKDMRLNKAFVSAGGVHSKLGVSCANFSEVGMKRTAIACAAQSYLVIDGSKVGKVKPAYFAACPEFEAIICERGPIQLEGVEPHVTRP